MSNICSKCGFDMDAQFEARARLIDKLEAYEKGCANLESEIAHLRQENADLRVALIELVESSQTGTVAEFESAQFKAHRVLSKAEVVKIKGINMSEQKRPTIEELEKILASDERAEIRVAPDGSVFVSREIDRLTIDLQRHKAALEKALGGLDELSRLGNGPMIGNSLGNEIAQDAISAVNSILNQPTPQ